MRCPACDAATLTPQYREGVEIDWCARCRGVWLDRGELDKLLDRLSAYRGSNDARRGEQSMYRAQSASPAMRRRRSFLAELFDFD
ncbi:zf-TFIIB domain-containing protein|uniref:TFIIB-type zinc ribbon-containing protein n=1 Tax=Noviherbaspirillum sp. L7-7A TaxID=2850560 RepID=UPI001C2C5FEE|nr:zf-TFIIB domain-containing protein [Noviherbaspirillum sp. L7-7A]MBV0880541.1 zf-TFIIB domain-containing protein [Noviherbaspirillum sp. L7-7A]